MRVTHLTKKKKKKKTCYLSWSSLMPCAIQFLSRNKFVIVVWFDDNQQKRWQFLWQMTDRTKKEDEEENKQTKVQQLALANINFSYRILYMYSLPQRHATKCQMAKKNLVYTWFLWTLFLCALWILSKSFINDRWCKKNSHYLNL